MKSLMKILFFLMAIPMAFSQNTDQSIFAGDGNLYINKTGVKETLNLSDIEGSPYFQNDFLYAFVDEDTSKPHKLRYNAYKDEMEFMNNGEIYYIDKNKYKSITFEPFKKYVLVNYELNNEEVHGYLIEILAGNYSLYQTERKKFLPERTVSRGLSETHTPAQFREADEVFFIKLQNGNILELPSSKSKLADLFGDYSKSVNQYLKENKISLKNQNNLKKLFQYINSL